MAKTAVFKNDTQLDGGPLVPKGTEGPVTEMYYVVNLNGKQIRLPESVVGEDGILKMPIFTLDDSSFKEGTKVEIVKVQVGVDCCGGTAIVYKDDVLITEEEE